MTRAGGDEARGVYKGVVSLHRLKYLLKAMPTSSSPFLACTLGVGLPGVGELAGSPQGRPAGKQCAQECKQFSGKKKIAHALPVSDKKEMEGRGWRWGG